MAAESDALHNLKAIAEQMDELRARYERENARMRTAIILLTDVVDEILPFVVTDEAVIARARAANQAARATIHQC